MYRKKPFGNASEIPTPTKVIQYCLILSKKGRKGHLFFYENKFQVFYQNDNDELFFWKGGCKLITTQAIEVARLLSPVILFLTIRVLVFGSMAGKSLSTQLREEMIACLLSLSIYVLVNLLIMSLSILKA